MQKMKADLYYKKYYRKSSGGRKVIQHEEIENWRNENQKGRYKGCFLII